MFYAAKGFCNLAYNLIFHQALHHGDGSHIIFHVVDTGNENIHNRKHRPALPVNNPLFQGNIAIPLPGEEAGSSIAPERGSDCIVPIQNQQALGILIAENIFLCLHILFHILVDIQMVGGQIGNQGTLRAAGHIHQLEGAELHYGIIFLLHFPDQRKQGCSDVSSQPYRFSCRFEHFRNQSGGCGLAVRTGYRNQVAWTDLKKDFHFRSNLGAPAAQGNNCRITGVHARCAEDNVRLHALQIIFANMELAAHFFQLQNLRIQIFPGGFVTANHAASKLQQQTNQRTIADAQAQNCYFFILQGCKISFKSRNHDFPHFPNNSGIVALK